MTIPVTVLTGFLGAGKTTLLNRLLHNDHGRRLGVIVNEFGEAGIDGELLASGPEEIVELSNGCVCCTVRGDLLRALHGLDARTRLDGVVIEMSGLADPAPVAQTFLWDEALGDRFALDGIVAVADALYVRDQLRDHPEAAEQVAFADLLVLTKTDLADPADLPAVRAALADASPTARVVTADHGALDPTTILGLGGYDLTRLDAHGPQDHHHSHGLGTVTLTACQPLDEEQVMGWLTAYLARHGSDILRLKAILDIEGEDRRLSLQGVHMILEGDFFAPWPAGPRQSRLVLIGRGLDRAALQSAFDACIA